MATAFDRTMACKTVARPGFGDPKVGREINLFANFYRMKFNPRLTVYHYDIEIEPKCPKFLKRKLIHTFSQKHKATLFKNGLPVYDGNKNLYSSVQLDVSSEAKAVEVDMPETPDSKARKFKVLIKYAATIDMSCLEQVLKGSGYGDIPQETLLIADVVVRHFPSLRYTIAGRSMFTKPDKKYDLSGTTEMWSGVYTSARPSNWGLVLNVDESHTAFYQEQGVLEFMTNHLKINQLQPNFSLKDSERNILEKQLKFLRVSVTHQSQKRQYRVEKLTQKPASQISFDVEGRKISIAQYFKETYKYTLKYPNLPCIWVSPKEKNTFIPMEVCAIVAGQRCVRKLTDDETRNMIRGTAKKPPLRKQGTEDQMNAMQFTGDPYLKQFGFEVDKQMVQVKGKVINPPKLGYSKGTCVAQGGTWDNRGKQFFNPMHIQRWAILMFPPQNRCQSGDVKAFCDSMIKIGADNGMRIAQPGFVKYCREGEIDGLINELKAKIQGGPIDLVYCILPPGSSSCYAKIKHTFENKNAISTQCMELRNLKPPKPQTIGNILQKMNAKIGGTNNTAIDMMEMPIFKTPCIIMGADNAAPAQGEGSRPSVCALVGSVDKFACRYSTQIGVQKTDGTKAHSPIIHDMEKMVKNTLIKFYQAMKIKPQRIIFYRDGVSEGQFYNVMVYEVDAIKKACASLEKGYNPRVTFIICQKRHHTRLFAQNPRDADRSGNVPAGTVVDQGITSTTDFDFYLNSHAGIQGTNKPAKYHVLVDENNFPADKLYQLTFHLCHVYARCTRSVSVPAPTYYARLATDRARAHLDKTNFESSDGTSSVGGGAQQRQAPAKPTMQDILQDISPHDATKNKMYWI